MDEMAELKLKIGKALCPALEPFHCVDTQALRLVRQVIEDDCVTRLILEFENSVLVVVADPDDDSISFFTTSRDDEQAAAGVDISELNPWNSVLGKPFAWGWVTVNQQGYCDGLLLSFERILPQLLLNVVASAIRTSAIRQV